MTDGSFDRQVMLALETSGDVCGVAILRGGVLVVERTFRHEMHLSERLMDQIDGTMRDVGYALTDVTAFAVGIGPGSFTGTRIGVMTIKTLAAVLSRPVYGIDSLAALAFEYCGLNDLLNVPMQPCRAGTVFTGVYTVSGSRPEPLWPTDALAIGDLALRLRETTLEDPHDRTPDAAMELRAPSALCLCFCGSAAARYRAPLEELLLPDFRLSFGSATFPRAAAVGALAWTRHLSGDADDPLALAPRYISPPPITLPRQPIPQPVATAINAVSDGPTADRPQGADSGSRPPTNLQP